MNIDVKSFGAIGDGLTDDTMAIRTALSSAADVIEIPDTGSPYLITDTLAIVRPLTLRGRGTLQMRRPNIPLLSVMAPSDIIIQGLGFRGPQYGNPLFAASSNEAGIYAANTTRLCIEDCHFDSWGFRAINIENIHSFWTERNVITNTWYAGIECWSCVTGTIRGNIIDGVTASGEAYGIALTRNDDPNLITYPRCKDIMVEGNFVYDVPSWEGYDTHAGERITFKNNVARNVRIGINAGRQSRAAYSPKDILIDGNHLESFAGGNGWLGITLNNYNDPDGPATGIIKNNTIKGFGLQSNIDCGAIHFYGTSGLIIEGNRIVEACPNAINASFGVGTGVPSVGFLIIGNVIVDPWTNTNSVGDGCGINIHGKGMSGRIADNIYLRGSKVATYVLGNNMLIAPGNPNCVI